MATPKQDTNSTGEVVPISRDAVLAQFGERLMVIPEREPDDGSGIIANILMATDWEAVNMEGKLPDAESTIGRRMWIQGFGRVKSDLEDGYPWYLIIDAVDKDTGETLLFQTSSQTIMAQLVQLIYLNSIPALVMVQKAEKATRSGYFPLNLKVIAVDPDRA